MNIWHSNCKQWEVGEFEEYTRLIALHFNGHIHIDAFLLSEIFLAQISFSEFFFAAILWVKVDQKTFLVIEQLAFDNLQESYYR